MIYELTMQLTRCHCWGLGSIFQYHSGTLSESHCTQIVLIKMQNTKFRHIGPSSGTAGRHATLKYLSTSIIFYHRTVACGRTKRNYVPDSNYVPRRFRGKVAGLNRLCYFNDSSYFFLIWPLSVLPLWDWYVSKVHVVSETVNTTPLVVRSFFIIYSFSIYIISSADCRERGNGSRAEPALLLGQ